MKENWIVQETQKADPQQDLVILEKPGVQKYLDHLLLSRFWPTIQGCLDASRYPFDPLGNPKTELQMSRVLTRSLSFMLFDEAAAFYRGILHCSLESWMLENEFFLGLSKDTDPQIVFEILGNSRFRGYPPTLSIDKSRDHIYEITFRSGRGADWGLRG